jgi:Fic family protein
LFLIQEDLPTRPILYVSRFIIRHKEEYTGLLIDVTRSKAWEPWLLDMLQAVRETADWTLAKVEAIRNLVETTAIDVREKIPKI